MVTTGQAMTLDRLAAAIKELPLNRAELLRELMERQAYTVEEVAEMWGVHPATIRRAIARGDLKAFTLGASEPGKGRTVMRIPAAEVLRIMELGPYALTHKADKGEG